MKRHTLLALGTLLVALAGTVAAPAIADDDRRGRHGHDRDHDRYDRGRWSGRDHDRRRDDDRRWDDRRGHDDRRWHDRDRYRHGYSHWDRSDPRRVVYVGPPAPTYVVRHRPYREVHYGPPGPPPWARGRHYRYHGYGPTYVVHDYRPYRHRLYAPPRGYYWRRSDAGEFLLVAIATGIIADIVLNH
jgi:Ni/Co efflux regulator RcnB